MIAKGKKTVSLAYKDKLVAELAYYEKRIAEALQKNNSTSLNTIEDDDSSDDDSNPYTLNTAPSRYELKQLEASLGSRASMTLELAMLTIMQSEVNIMMTPPDVRRPVKEDGTWLEVAAECKIDLVSFTITFYAHKPHRKFAPISYRNLEVTLTKAAHEKELSPSVLSKLKLPNLALQVLQSYAAAFRSRRTTLLDLAATYADQLKMEAMPEGGYRVRFLDLLTMEWTLENMWSPVVPFCHRMKFEVEYMPPEYIQSIGRLYKQFKDPALETGERSRVLARILDVCLAARADNADGPTHERRTTIDQEPEIPSNYVQVSEKQPKPNENKVQNRKTTMEPPKAIPKKAKKVAKKSRPNSEASNDESVSKRRKPNGNGVRVQTDVSEKNKPNDKEDMAGNRKGIKRVIENDSHDITNAKKIRSENGDNFKSGGDKGINNDGASDANKPNDTSKHNAPKKDKVASTKNLNRGDPSKKGDLKSTSAPNVNRDEPQKGDLRSASEKNVNRDNSNKKGDFKSVSAKNGNKGELSKKGDLKSTSAPNVNKDDPQKGDLRSASETNVNRDNSNKKGDLKSVSAKNRNKDDPNKKRDLKSTSAPNVNKDEPQKGDLRSASETNVNRDNSNKKRDLKSTTTSTSATNVNKDEPNKKRDLKSASATSLKKADDNEKNADTDTQVGNVKDKNDAKGNVENPKSAKNKVGKEIVVHSEPIDKANKISNKKNTSDETNAVSSKNSTQKSGEEKSSKVLKDKNSVEGSKKITQKTDDVNTKTVYKNVHDKNSELLENVEKNSNKVTNVAKIVDKVKKVAKSGEKVDSGKLITNSKNVKPKNTDPKNVKQKNVEQDSRTVANVIKPSVNINRETGKKTSVKEANAAAKQKNPDDLTSKANSEVAKQRADKDTEKNKISDVTFTKSDDGKSENADSKQIKNAPNIKENNPLRIHSTKNTLIQSNNTNAISNGKKLNNDQNKKTVTNVEKAKIVSKVNNEKENKTAGNIMPTSNRNETVQKLNEINKAPAKIPAKTNIHGIINKPVSVNLKTLNKQTNVTEKGTNQKFANNQAKITQQLKTKIPMMKSKLKMSTLINKLDKKATANAVEPKGKLPQKSLPVFKKLAKNPTRMSPRKLPPSFKPSSHGFSSK